MGWLIPFCIGFLIGGTIGIITMACCVAGHKEDEYIERCFNTEDKKMKVKIKKLHVDAKIPTKGSEKAAAYDLYAYIANRDGVEIINPHETVKIGTGLSMAPPEGYFVGVYARSGLSSKEGLRPANCVGVCDEDYRGEYIVALHNDSNHGTIVRHGDRIAQVILHKRYDMDFQEVEELDATERGHGGFGSTGMN